MFISVTILRSRTSNVAKDEAIFELEALYGRRDERGNTPKF